ncbi:MAG: FliM/FliN family flagellar motor C-terminal domain-containing protein [Pseudomonadota bacterium]
MSAPDATAVDAVEIERRASSPENAQRRAVYDIMVDVAVSLGQARMSVAEILNLRPESIIPLAAKVEDPIALTVDGRVVAWGDLIETEDGILAVRITEITGG